METCYYSQGVVFILSFVPFLDEADWNVSLSPPLYKQNAISHLQSLFNAYKHFWKHTEAITKIFEVFFTLRSVLVLRYPGLLPVPSYIEKETMFLN